MSEIEQGSGGPEQPDSFDREAAIHSASSQLVGEALGGGDAKFSEAHQKLTAEDWEEVRRRTHDKLVGPKPSSSRQEREAARESMSDEEKAKDDLMNRAAGQLAGEALGGGSANIGEEYKVLTAEDWEEVRKRAGEIARGV